MDMRLLIFLFAASIVATTIHPAAADPTVIVIDVENREDAPEQFGYKVAAAHDRDYIVFTIDLTPSAAESFKSAKVVATSPDENTPDIAVKVKENAEDKTKRVTFAVSTETVAGFYLVIDSGPLREKDGKLEEFAGYRLRLDNVTPE